MNVLDAAMLDFDSMAGASQDQSITETADAYRESFQDMTPSEANYSIWESALVFGSEAIDQALGLDLLPNAQMVIAGRTEGQLASVSNSMFADGFVALVTELGEVDWITQIGSSAVDQFLDVIYHPNDLIIAGGFSTGDLPGQVNSRFADGLLVALNIEGDIIWQSLIDLGTVNRLVGVDDGFIAVGSYDFMSGDYAAFVAKYNLAGEREWLQSLNSPSYDSASSVTVHQNRIFVSGFTSGSIIESVEKEHMDIFVAAFSLEGERIWLKEYGSAGDDSAVRIDHDQESLIIAGYTSGLLGTQQYGDNDVAVLKIDFEGEVIWQQQFGTAGSEAAYGLSISPEQNIFISGRIDEGSWDEQINLNGDAFITKLTALGELVSVVQFHREGRDEIVDLIHKHNQLSLAGYAVPSPDFEAEQSDIFIHRISANEGF